MDAKEELQSCLHEKQYQSIVNTELEKLFVEMLELQDMGLFHTLRYEKLNKLIEKDESLIEESEVKVNIIKDKINQLKQPYKNILLLRYINGKSYEDISTETSYSTPRIFQLHREAVNVYNEKYFDKNENSSLEDELTL